MKNITFLTGTVAQADGIFPHKLSLEVDRTAAFSIIEKLNAFIENIPIDSRKATFLHFVGEAITEGETE